MKIYIGLILMFCGQLSFAQLTREELSLKEWPQSYQLDIQEQKKKESGWKNEKRTKYTVNFFDEFYIDSQVQYDSLKNNKINEHRYNYQYYPNGNLQYIFSFDGKDEPTGYIYYGYDENNDMVFEKHYDQTEKVEKTITFENCRCTLEYLKDLIIDSELEDLQNVYSCQKTTTINEVSKYKYININVTKYGLGIIKKLSMNVKDSTINRTYINSFDAQSNIIKQTIQIKNGPTKTYFTKKYNDKNDLIEKTSNFSTLNYVYKYDNHNNWIQKIETSKNTSKRILYTRTLSY